MKTGLKLLPLALSLSYTQAFFEPPTTAVPNCKSNESLALISARDGITGNFKVKIACVATTDCNKAPPSDGNWDNVLEFLPDGSGFFNYAYCQGSTCPQGYSVVEEDKFKTIMKQSRAGTLTEPLACQEVLCGPRERI